MLGLLITIVNAVLALVSITAQRLVVWTCNANCGDHRHTPFVVPRVRVQTTSALVRLGYASYQGTALENEVNQYLGISFAAPPLGNLRWRAPADPVIVHGVQSADEFKPICLGISQGWPSTTQSEDCLYLNVWAPRNATRASKLPVWLFIQGGGYISNANADYEGTGVVEESGGNIVFVNFNYRVGPYGFLASEKVRENGVLNAGLLDQRKVMEWVKKYISLFGGDPDAVVVHGASAGAGSLALHLTAYGGRDDSLFVGAIGESLFFPTQPKVEELEFQFDRFAEGAGCTASTGAKQMACLRALDTGDLQAQNQPSAYVGAEGDPKFYWTPAIDGDFIQDYPYSMFERGSFVKVPMMFGNANDEGSKFADNAETPEDVARFMHNNFPHLTQTDLDAINKNYPLMDPVSNHAAYFPSLSAAYGESTFICPTISILQQFVNHFDASKIWFYHFNVQDQSNIDDGVGVSHTFEIPAIFGVDHVSFPPESYSTYNKAIVPIIQDYFISFVRSLSPNRYKNEAAPLWEAYSNKQKRMLLQTNATAMERVPKKQLRRCDFWKELATTMET